MGQHSHNSARPPAGNVRITLPTVERTPAPPSNPALLPYIGPVHGERMAALEALHAQVSADVNLTCKITEHGGYPVLDVYRVRDLKLGNPAKRVRIGVRFEKGAWWYVTPGPSGPNYVAAIQDA